MVLGGYEESRMILLVESDIRAFGFSQCKSSVCVGAIVMYTETFEYVTGAYETTHRLA